MSATTEAAVSPKDRALAMLARLPDDVTWDQIEYDVSVCRILDERLDRLNCGEVRLVPQDEVRRMFGLDPK